MSNPEIDNYCENEADQWRRKYEEERAIVDRIWKILGNPSYEELNGRSIYELIEGLKAHTEKSKVICSEKDKALNIK